jgi:flagellar hook-basal body complex protein FliE
MIPIITAVAGVLSALSSLSSLANTPAPAADPAPPADPSASAAASGAAAPFADTLQSALNRVDGTVAGADQKAQAFASGDQSVSLSDVMISLEEANLALQGAAAVRDKVVAAYNNVMNMPV